MEKNYNIDDIENFLNQEMGDAELAAFEKEMAKDEALKMEVDFHEDVVKGIQTAGPAAFRAMVSGVHGEMKAEGFFSESTEEQQAEQTTVKEAKVRRIGMFRQLAIAASFALLLTAGWFMFSQPSTPDQLFADNFTVHQDVLSVEIADRLAETGFGTNKDALATLQTAIDTYKSGDYTNAIEQFTAFETTAPEDALATYAQFYEAVALLETGQSAAAQNELLSIIDKANFPLQNEARWYLSLAYLKQNKVTEAKAILQNLSTVTNYEQKAKKLLNKL